MNEEVRLVGNGEHEEDIWQYSLRPKLFNEYVGQEEAKGNLNVYIQAAKQRGEALDHVLLYGPPGLGKTTLAGIIANELGVNFRITSGPAIEKSGDLAAILTNLDDHDVLFIDEIHRLSRSVEEVLYSAMEDYAIDIIIGKGPSARTVRIDLPKFTLVGATTRAGALAAPLRDRFGIINRLEYYKQPELEFIVEPQKYLILVLCRLGQAKLHVVHEEHRVSQTVCLNGYAILHKSLVMGLSLKKLQMKHYNVYM